MTTPGAVQSDGLPVEVTEEQVAYTTVAALGLTGAVAASRYVGATTSGAPSSGTFAIGDFAIDQTGAVWICTAAGSPGTWAQSGSSVSGILDLASGTDTADCAAVLVPTFASGTAAQLSDTTRDYVIYLAVTTSGTATTVAIGPTSTPAHTILPSSSVTAGQLISFRLPAGWYVKWAGTDTAFATQTAIGC